MSIEDNFDFKNETEDKKVSPETGIDTQKKEQMQEVLADEAEKLAEYTLKNEKIEDQILQTGQEKTELENKIQQIREKLHDGEIPSQIETPSLDVCDNKLRELLLKKVETSANYPGDWTLLLMDRMFDPITKQKFIETRTGAMLNMKPGEIPSKPKDGVSYVKEEEYQAYYQKQVDEYDANVHKIFDRTYVEKSSEYDKKPYNLGKGEIGFEGVVFADGEKRDGTPLSNREKNIIESHEKGHGLRDFVAEDRRDFTQSIDLDVVRAKDAQTGVREIGYLRMAEEIAERMAQLKNYFGMKAEDVFTKEHLEYAKQKYTKDIPLDNNMTTFFEAITPHTIDKFIETINRHPL